MLAEVERAKNRQDPHDILQDGPGHRHRQPFSDSADRFLPWPGASDNSALIGAAAGSRFPTLAAKQKRGEDGAALIR